MPSKEKKQKEVSNKVARFALKATIPVVQYGNLQPEIEMRDVDLKEAQELSINVMKGLWDRFSESGKLKEKNISATVTLKSFNEPDVEVEFDTINHTYSYKGKTLVSATNYLKQFYKPFDTKTIAKACAKSWEVDQQDIENMWAVNGDLASTLGTLIDNALEHYSKYFEMGEKIKAKNGKENPAMPKHPLLKGIIEAFHALPHIAGEVKHQILVTDVEGGFCGQMDHIVITGEKQCDIDDFKVNIDSDKEDKNLKPLAPFNELPATKLTKYAIQVNFYREMLVKSGWTVGKLQAFVFEDQWKVFELPIINVINRQNDTKDTAAVSEGQETV